MADEKENQLDGLLKTAENAQKALDDYKAQLEGCNKTMADYKSQLDGVKADNEKMRKELFALQQGAAAPVAGTASAKTAGERFAASQEYQAFKSQIAGNRHASFKLDLAAAPETTQASNSVSRTTFAPPAELGIVTDPRQVLALESLFGHVFINSSAYQYVKYGYVTTETATGPAVTAEAAAKPEANYSGTIVNGAVSTIAGWTKVTEQMLQDDANLVSFINDDLAYQLNLVIDHQIAQGTGSGQLKGLNQSGNYTDYITPAGLESGDTVIDLILKVKGAMEAAAITNIAVLLNPQDWVEVLGVKNVNKDYIVPGILDLPAQRIWGTPVILSSSVQKGKFHMGNFALGAKIIERAGLSVEMDREGDDFTKNLMTIRAERRLDLAVVQPKALAYGNFAATA